MSEKERKDNMPRITKAEVKKSIPAPKKERDDKITVKRLHRTPTKVIISKVENEIEEKEVRSYRIGIPKPKGVTPQIIEEDKSETKKEFPTRDQKIFVLGLCTGVLLTVAVMLIQTIL